MDLGFAGGSYASRGGDRPESGAASADGGDPVLQQLDSYDAKLKNWRKWRAEAREMRDMVDGHQWPQEAIDAVLDEDETTGGFHHTAERDLTPASACLVGTEHAAQLQRL